MPELRESHSLSAINLTAFSLAAMTFQLEAQSPIPNGCESAFASPKNPCEGAMKGPAILPSPLLLSSGPASQCGPIPNGPSERIIFGQLTGTSKYTFEECIGAGTDWRAVQRWDLETRSSNANVWVAPLPELSGYCFFRIASFSGNPTPEIKGPKASYKSGDLSASLVGLNVSLPSTHLSAGCVSNGGSGFTLGIGLENGSADIRVNLSPSSAGQAPGIGAGVALLQLSASAKLHLPPINLVQTDATITGTLGPGLGASISPSGAATHIGMVGAKVSVSPHPVTQSGAVAPAPLPLRPLPKLKPD